jgi:hypothetical protein
MTIIDRYATVDVDDLSVFYDGRVVTDPVVTRGLVDPFFGPIRLENTSVVLSNRDGALTAQFLAQDGWRNRSLVIKRFDRFTLETRVAWIGIVSESSLDGDAGTITLTGTNVDLSILEQTVPNDLITKEEFSLAVDVGKTKPKVFGTARKMPLPYINDDVINSCFDYFVETGSHFTVDAVFRVGGTTGSTVSTVQCDPSEYVVSTSNWPGYTTIRFALRQVGFQEVAAGATSGFIPILATVTNTTGEERNPIRVIRLILENAVWGLGKTVNDAAFDAAEDALTAFGPYYVDGAMTIPAAARDWLTELCMFRGIRLAVNASGEWYPIVDDAEVGPTMILGDGPGDGERNLLAASSRAFADVNSAVRNAHISFREDLAQPGTFRQRAKYARVVNADFGADRPYTNRFIWQQATADRVLCGLWKRLVLDQQRIHLTTGQAGRALEPGQVVQVTVERLGLSDALLEVVSVEESIEKAELICRPWNDGIYTYTPSDEIPDDTSEDTPPDVPTNLEEGDNVNAGDGTASVTIIYDNIQTIEPAEVFVERRLDTETTWTRDYHNPTPYGSLGEYLRGFAGTAIEQTTTGLLLNTDYVFRCVARNGAGLETISDELAVHTAS